MDWAAVQVSLSHLAIIQWLPWGARYWEKHWQQSILKNRHSLISRALHLVGKIEKTHKGNNWKKSEGSMLGRVLEMEHTLWRSIKQSRKSVFYNVTYQLQTCGLEHSFILLRNVTFGQGLAGHCWGSIPLCSSITGLPRWALPSAVAQVGLASRDFQSSSLWQGGWAPKQVSEENQAELVLSSAI